MSRPKVICTHKIPEVGLKKLREVFDVIILDESKPIDAQLREELPNVEYLVPLLSVNITRELMKISSTLKGVANYAVGYNNIDIQAARELNILVTNTPDVLTNATADLTWALILAVTRRIIEGDKICRENAFKGWLPEYLLGFEVTGKILGIVGAGRIGTAVGKRALGFDMKVIYTSRTRKTELEERYDFEYYENLDDLLKKADIVSLNLPYSSVTHHLITARELNLMKKTSFLINTARGKVVKEEDLIKALKTRQIGGAGLDVFYNEPDIPIELRKLSNVVLTPHIGSATIKARSLMSLMVAENILAMERGETPPNLIQELRKKD
ncbi:MAG: 2-hydroxyacid dehydrogenase [Candidatus Hodarchaeales archaeon]